MFQFCHGTCSSWTSSSSGARGTAEASGAAAIRFEQCAQCSEKCDREIVLKDTRIEEKAEVEYEYEVFRTKFGAEASKGSKLAR